MMERGADPPENVIEYLLPSRHGVGQRLALGTIDRRLRKVPLGESLLRLSRMCFRAERAGGRPVNVAAQLRLVQEYLPTGWRRRANEILEHQFHQCVVFSPQVIVLLGIRLMAVSQDDDRQFPLGRLDSELGALCLAFADHVEQGSRSPDTITLETLRLQLFYGEAEHAGWLSVAGRLFFDTLPRLATHPAWCDPLRRFESETGICVQYFWAITMLQGMAASYSDEHFKFPANTEPPSISPEDLDRWRALMASPLADAMEAARVDIAQPVSWSMSAVWKRPVIDIARSKGPVLRGWLLQMQAEPSQMFWHIRDVVVGQGVPHRQWSDLYGAAVEDLGIELLTEHVSPSEILVESEFVQRWKIPPNSKRADAAIITDRGDLVVIDFVSRQFTRDTTTIGDFSALARDLRLGVIEKLEQVDATLNRAIKSGDGKERLFPVVVLAGRFPMFPPLDQTVNEGLETLGMSVIGVHPDCRPWMALDLANWMMLLRISTLTATSVPDLRDAWQRSPLGRTSFREWAVQLDD